MPPNESQPETAAASASAGVEDDNKATLTNDNVDVKFVSGESKIEMGDKAVDDDPYRALTKDELMQFAKDPFWVRLRWALFVLFWVTWVGMLVASGVILILAKKCYSPEPKQWWQKAPVYDIQVASFKDSNRDGTGDLNGIASKVDYLESLGIGSLLLSPIFADDGSFTAIKEKYGTMEDFDKLVTTLDDAGIKLMLDFIPNHTGDDHEWFRKSASQDERYKDYYVWKEGSRSNPPNRWQAVGGGSAWTYNAERGAWYLSLSGANKPDLNLRNDAVFAEVEKAMNFWLKKGVTGFRMDSVMTLVEDLDSGDKYDVQDSLELLRDLRKVLDKVAEEEGTPRIMMTDADVSIEELEDYYGTNFTAHAGDIAHMPINFDFAKAFIHTGFFSNRQHFGREIPAVKTGKSLLR